MKDEKAFKIPRCKSNEWAFIILIIALTAIISFGAGGLINDKGRTQDSLECYRVTHDYARTYKDLIFCGKEMPEKITGLVIPAWDGASWSYYMSRKDCDAHSCRKWCSR